MVKNLKASGLWPRVEEDEQKLLMSNRVSKRQQINASWLGEATTCLLWALRMIPELPSYDEEIDPTLALLIRSKSIPELIRQARLRPRREILKQRQIAELWHWRARTRRLQEQGRLDDESVAGTKLSRSSSGPQHGMRDSDGYQMRSQVTSRLWKPYRDLSSDEFAILSSIAQERHRALNWVCGESPTGRWEDTRTDT